MSTTNPRDIESEWDSIQRKFGNLPPKPATVTEEQRTKELVNQLEQVDVLEGKTLKQLDELEDDVEEDMLEIYRQKRLQELKRRTRRNRFGELQHLGKDEFVEEVTKASAVDPDDCFSEGEGGRASSYRRQQQPPHGDNDEDDAQDNRQSQPRRAKGTWVVVHMYQDSIPSCVLLNRCLAVLASRHRYVKFLKAKSRDIVAQYPDDRLPTLLLYYAGSCQKQIVGKELWGGAESPTVDTVEKALRHMKVLEETEADSDTESREQESCSSDDERHRIRSKGYASTRLDTLLGKTR